LQNWGTVCRCLAWFTAAGLLPRRGNMTQPRGFNPISPNLIKALTGRMYFVPEGQHDRSQARIAWRHEENSPVPAGRCDRSQARSAWNERQPKEPSRKVRYDSCRDAHRFDMAPISTRNTSGIGCARSYRTYGTVLSRDPFPGTSCLATIVLSLRDADLQEVFALSNVQTPCCLRGKSSAADHGKHILLLKVSKWLLAMRTQSSPTGDRLLDSATPELL
jgi:hypothetical protein